MIFLPERILFLVEREFSEQLKTDKIVIGTIPNKWNHWLVNEIRKTCEIIEVTKENRETISEALCQRIRCA